MVSHVLSAALLEIALACYLSTLCTLQAAIWKGLNKLIYLLVDIIYIVHIQRNCSVGISISCSFHLIVKVRNIIAPFLNFKSFSQSRNICGGYNEL